MHNYIRCILLICVGVLLLIGNYNNAITQTKDEIMSKAKQLLDEYTPPPPTGELPTVTPQEAWTKYYREKMRHTPSGGDKNPTINANGSMHVNTMPSYFESKYYGNAQVSVPIDVWGNVNGGVPPYKFRLEFGDGEMYEDSLIDNGHFLGTKHSYTNSGMRMMRLTVTDADGISDADSSFINVIALPDLQDSTNMAIEKGLLYLYLIQYPTGDWYEAYGTIAATGASILSFEENGHLSHNDFDQDIYAEYVNKGLNYLLTNARTMSISTQTAGNPDSDGDGIGVYLDANTYANGLGLLAILGAHADGDSAKIDTISVGPRIGRTYYDFMVDALDQIAYSQTDPNRGVFRGGWRYCANCAGYSNSDNSATQWPGLVIEAAEHIWRMNIPQFVKDELWRWLQYSQAANGNFGYYADGNGALANTAKTGAGIGCYAALDSSSTSLPVQRGINFLDNQWNAVIGGLSNWSEHLYGNLYAMYAVAKGLRILDGRLGVQFVGSREWYPIYQRHLLNHSSWRQRDDGSWVDGEFIGGPNALSSSLALLVLTPGVIQKRPDACIQPITPKPRNTAFNVDGSCSSHLDPNKSIIEYLWDWNASDGIDWNHPDASGMSVSNPGYPDTGWYTITLRVKDNSLPDALYDEESGSVLIQIINNKPISIPIPHDRGPIYAGKVDECILFDGRESHDPDSGDAIDKYEWDIDGNGTYHDTSDIQPGTVTWCPPSGQEYSGTVNLRVTDTYGATGIGTAAIRVIASRKDIFVDQFTVMPTTIAPGGTLDLSAVFKNDDSSNVGVSNVLVRFYDEYPLTIGTQLGSDFSVDLPIGGTSSIATTVTLPNNLPIGPRKIYVYLDANDHVAEWNEINNFAFVEIMIDTVKPCGIPATLRDDFNVPESDGTELLVAGRYKWSHMLNHPAGGVMVIEDSLIEPGSRLPLYDYGSIVWDSLVTGGSEASLTVVKKSGFMINKNSFKLNCDTANATLKLYARMDSKDYYAGKGYELRWTEEVGIDRLDIVIVGPQYWRESVLATAKLLINPGDSITFRVDCDNRTMVGLVNDNTVVSVLDSTYNPDQWYFVIRTCKFPTTAQFDDFKVSQTSHLSVMPQRPLKRLAEMIPEKYALEQNFPNPFNPTTTFRFGIPTVSAVRLEIYNMIGQRIATLVNEELEEGYYEISWTANVTSGIYFYSLESINIAEPNKSFKDVKKMLLLK